MLLSLTVTGAAQSVRVTGSVVDAGDGQPLPGVNIQIKGTLQGTNTDIEGKFTLNVPKATDLLIFSYLGYNTQEIALEGRTELLIRLESRALQGEEVIVVGYGTVSRKDLTGSVSQVSSRELTQVSVANTTELITGRVAGLMAKSTTGLPGSEGTTLRIRGYANPLVLVDGVEMSFDRVDPNDIESISVLKDASAAIYGARAGNGVILVTTKRGDRGAPRIDIRSNISFEQPTQLVTPVNAAQYMEMIREGELNGGLNPSVTQEEIDAYRRGDPGYESYNWYNAVFRPWAPTRAYSGSVSGGSKDVVYFLSAGNLRQESAFRSGDYNFERYNIRANVDSKVRENISVFLNFSGRVEGITRTSESQDEIFGGLMRSQPIYNPNLPNGAPAYAGFGNVSPKAISYSDVRGLTETTNDRVEGAFGAKWKLPYLSGFEAEARMNYRYIANLEWANSKSFEVFSYDEPTDTYVLRGGRGVNSVNRGEYRDRWLNPVVSLRYAGVFGDHNVSGLAVAEYIDEYRKGFSASRLNPISPDVPFLNAGSTEGMGNGDFWTEAARVSYIGRLQYGYQDRYRVETTVRADATHKFAPGSRWGVFPSISGSWSLHNEKFFKVKPISELRFRVSYSQTGDDTGVAAYRYLSDYIIRDNLFLFDDQVVRRIGEQGLPNPNVTWLDMTSTNYGVNLGLFDQKLTMEFNLFKRKTDNIFGTALSTFPSTFGAVLPPLNINARENNGYEIELTHKHRIGDVRYSVSANMAHSREKYVRWSEPTYTDPDDIRLFRLTGSYVNRWIGYKSNGMFMTQAAIDNHPVNQDGQGNITLRPGDIRYVDLNKDGKIDFRDQTDIGRGAFPDMSYGFSLDVSYKGFALNALFQGASKFNLNMTGRARGPFDNDGIPHVYQYKHRWTPDPNNPDVNINPNAQLPAIEIPGLGTNANNNLTSDFWLRDGTYLRLKNLNLSYSIPTKLVQSVGMSNLRVYVSGSNLITWDRLGIYSGSFDPEVPVTNAGRYPNVRTVTFGFDVQI